MLLTTVGLTVAGLIHVLIELLILGIIGWIIVWILRYMGAPEILIKIVYVIGALIAILLLIGLIYPLGI